MKKSRADKLIVNTVRQLESLRQMSGMSQEDLAKKSGVTRPAISHIESGRRRPSLLMSLKLAEALGVRLSEILHKAEKELE